MSWIPIVLEVVFSLIENCSDDEERMIDLVYDESPMIRRRVNRAMRRAGVPRNEKRDVREAVLEEIYDASPAQIRTFCRSGYKGVQSMGRESVVPSNGQSRVVVGA